MKSIEHRYSNTLLWLYIIPTRYLFESRDKQDLYTNRITIAMQGMVGTEDK